MMHPSIQRSAAEELGNGPALTALERAVEKATSELVANRAVNHVHLQQPYISAQQVDEARGVGVIILAEHIDYDGGWCGNQFRYSVWVVREESDPREIYSDHSWYRPELRGCESLEGRNPRIDLIEVQDGGVMVRGTGNHGNGFGGEKKFSIGFDGSVREPQSFADQARNHIERIAPKLGYDRLSAFEAIPGEDIAAVTFTSENGRDYGYDTIYLVWRDKAGDIHARSLLETPEYSSIRRCVLTEESVEVVVVAAKEETFKIPVWDIGREASNILK